MKKIINMQWAQSAFAVKTYCVEYDLIHTWKILGNFNHTAAVIDCLDVNILIKIS